MKKVLILTMVLVFAATNSFAAIASGATGSLSFATAGTGLEVHAAATGTAATASTALIGKTSTGVSVAWSTNTAGYALMTQHKSGTKAYGSSYDSTALYQTIVDATPGTPAYNSGALTATDTTDFASASAWKAM